MCKHQSGYAAHTTRPDFLHISNFLDSNFVKSMSVNELNLCNLC